MALCRLQHFPRDRAEPPLRPAADEDSGHRPDFHRRGYVCRGQIRHDRKCYSSWQTAEKRGHHRSRYANHGAKRFNAISARDEYPTTDGRTLTENVHQRFMTAYGGRSVRGGDLPWAGGAGGGNLEAHESGVEMDGGGVGG